MKLVYSTFPSMEEAKNVGLKLVEERLCGCYNCWHIESAYWWEGKIVTDEEVACVFKTPDEKQEQLIKKLAEFHPYSEPAIFSIPVEKVSPGYEKWLKDVTGTG
ncbi:MAG: periplasmic divalent cation tolerance protein [Thermotogota bacterium]|nr:periplasmic divalent cation tolerance protein [Thermotogota bacterium]MDK2864329.1 periplasmic divalent cation tolerance protein [Thermotogota bacterium]HCZ06337.1 divalent-cation tolerance protein CutA [Thermotogota bacterium]